MWWSYSMLVKLRSFPFLQYSILQFYFYLSVSFGTILLTPGEHTRKNMIEFTIDGTGKSLARSVQG